jgi:SAM-dependent methyltransferase
VLRFVRGLFRRFFPRIRDPLLDADIVEQPLDRQFESAYRTSIDSSDAFVTARYSEGQRWRQVLAAFTPPPARVLDVGAGDGAIELAFDGVGYRTVSVESLWNETARKLGVRRVIADAAALPFRSEVFDAILFLETIEHVRQPARIGVEMSRVARRNAPLLLTTPARWRFGFARDPHFAIWGLVLMPSGLQRWIAARSGFTGPEHYVDRIYSSTGQIERALPTFRLERVLSRTRTPNRWFWDAIVMRKTSSSG